jgi:hypothetical protein
LADAEPYGDYLGHGTSHIDHWSVLQLRGQVPREVEYEEPPRGRVGYNKVKREFVLLADQCILGNLAAIELIIKALGLPEGTRLSSDVHYRCADCLSRLGEESV